MKALRLVLSQSSANYKKEETVENKMTYPLPPISTIIGALHNACGYRDYHPMDVSIQGYYEAMHREPYTDHCFLNTVEGDRGLLVKMKNKNLLSNAYEPVAEAKTQSCNFRKDENIQVYNRNLLEEYRSLKDINDDMGVLKKQKIDPLLANIKSEKKLLTEKKKTLDKKTEAYKNIVAQEKEIKLKEKRIKQEFKEYKVVNYEEPISHFRALTKSLKFYEILDGIHLILHIRAEEKVLDDLLEHAYDLKCIGRSEDMVQVENAEIVELQEEMEEDREIINEHSAYLDYDLVCEDCFSLNDNKGKINGTKYYLNKKYEIIDGKRIFEKKKVLYASDYAIEELSDGIYLDTYNGQTLIVNFL